VTEPARISAASEIVLAADDIVTAGKREFSEWDLTVAAWRRDTNRFGCRGYESQYPDHKRVMMEIMGQSKRDNPVRRGFLQRIRPNYYTLTALGRAEAERMRTAERQPSTQRSAAALYDAVSPFALHRAFRAWLEDRNEPGTWLGAAAFWGIQKNEPAHLFDQMRLAREAVIRAIKWCEDSKRESLTRGPSGGGELALGTLRLLLEFNTTLELRFARQITAIRDKEPS
jgi:hypothetical protein